MKTSKGEITVRSKPEADIALQIDRYGQDVIYEDLKIPYVKPEENKSYNPDFVLPESGIVVEVKGEFTSADRKKMKLVCSQYPEYDIRMLFVGSRKVPSERTISKTSKTTYAKWCESNNIKYADKTIPESWFHYSARDGNGMERILTEKLVIHCSATGPTQDIDASDIRSWHIRRGWRDIGYHFVIKRDGTVETGRASNEVGAHAKGHNRNSISICLVGGVDDENQPEANYTLKQWDSLRDLTSEILEEYPNITEIVGHNELTKRKACPCFDVQAWADRNNFI